MKSIKTVCLFMLVGLSLSAQDEQTASQKKLRFLTGVGIQRNEFSIGAQGLLFYKDEATIRLHARLGVEWYAYKKLFLYSGLEWMDKAGKREVRVYELFPVSSTAPKNYVIEISRSAFHYAQLALGMGYLIPAGKINIRPAAGIVPSVLTLIENKTRSSQTFNPEPQTFKNSDEFPQDWDLWWNGELRISVEPKNTFKHWGMAVFYQRLLKYPELGIAEVKQTNIGLQLYRWF